MTTSYDPRADVVDQLAGLTPGSTTYETRHRREKVAAATQQSYDALFDPALPDLPLTDRLLVAVYACTLSNAPALASHYIDRADAAGVAPAVRDTVIKDTLDDVAEPRLRAMLTFTRTLILAPIEGDKAAIERLPAAGITTPAVVALAQLIAFLSYQIRLTASLQALQALNATEAA
jgi:uncharacterized protein YciW